MTLEGAIKHYEENAGRSERKAKYNRNHGGYVHEAEARICEKEAKEYRQLAEWLKELQAYRKERNENA